MKFSEKSGSKREIPKFKDIFVGIIIKSMIIFLD